MPRAPEPWLGDVRAKVRFERGARYRYPSLRGGGCRRTADRGARYTATIDVPFYEPRRVTILFPRGSSSPAVRADGPSSSPHRYNDGTLCMWVPSDTPANTWTVRHGLLDLLDAIAAHLFREAWWRETNEWLGPQVAHAQVSAPQPADLLEAMS